jgi:hypothetical protein
MGKYTGMLLALTGALFLFAAAAFAQFETAEVLGTVRDASGGALPQAALTLTNENTGIEMKSAADENGNYDFFNVKAGNYTLTAELTGFNKFSTSGVVVNVQARQRVDVTLQVGSVTQSVDVKSAAEALETDTSEHGQVINTQQIVGLPLNGRNYSDLALLASNVHRSPLAAGLQSTPREGAFNANGMRSTYNNFLMDGLDNNAYSTSNQGFSNEVAQPSPDAIAEFKVITSNYSAEYGRVGGAVVNAAMRSGTNGFHGTAYDFLRNTELNSIGYIFGQRPSTFLKPTLQRNQFGVTIGGPIIKNRLFFFADYEGFRQLQKALNFDSIPTLTDRAGTLPVAVVDPRSGSVYAANRPIPITAMTPFAQQILNALPAPNGPGRSNNYQALLLNKDYGDKYDAKVDGQINDRMTAFLRFSQRKDNQYFQPDLPGPSGGNGNGYVRVLDQAAAAGYTWTITPESLFEARLGFTHILGGKFPPYLGGASVQDLYGLSGLPTASNIAGGLNSQSVSGFSQFGRQATNPQFQNPTTWDPKFNYSIVRGRHAIKTGFEFETIHTEVMDINPVYGLNAYAGQFGKPTCAQLGQASTCTVPADSTSYNLADFLFGLPSQVQLANYLITNYRQHQYFAYVQDDYRVNSKLTLNLGLRWEFATPRWERDNVLTNFDPATNSILKASNGGLYNRTLVNADYKDFAPRLGMAYSPNSKMVVRGGYGISYVHLNRLGSADELGINGPQVNIATINQALTNGAVPSGFIGQGSFPPGFDSSANFNPVNANIAYIPANTRWPYVQTWFFGVQQELPGNNLIDVSYNGNHGVRMPIIADYNQAFPNQPGQTLGIQARRPLQGFGAITWVDPAGSSNYNGLSMRFEHRFTAGLYFLNNFTWSKALGNTEQALETAPGYAVSNVQNIRNLSAERGLSSFDVQLMNVTSLVYQLPFGKGRKYGAHWNGMIDSVLGGWEVNTINSANSGLPVNVIYTPTAANDVTGRIPDYRGEAVMRPNLVGNPAGASGPASLNAYFNAAAFAAPSASAPFGNLGRNVFRGPSFWQWDLGVNKNFRLPFRETTALQFRSEFFNVLNHTNFGLPDQNINDTAFGTIRSTFPARQIQFALKLLF